VRVVSRKLLVNPSEIKNAVNLAQRMDRWHDPVEFKRIKELALLVLPSTIMRGSRRCPSQINGIIIRESSQSEFCNTIGTKRKWARRQNGLMRLKKTRLGHATYFGECLLLKAE